LHLQHKTFNSKTPGRENDFKKGLDAALGFDFTMLLYTASMGVGVEYTLELDISESEAPETMQLRFISQSLHEKKVFRRAGIVSSSKLTLTSKRTSPIWKDYTPSDQTLGGRSGYSQHVR
jgi:hypothetical protein